MKLKLKQLAVAALIFGASSQASAVGLTKAEIALCGELADTAVVIVEARDVDKMTRQQVYRYIVAEVEESLREPLGLVVDLVFKGYSPDRIFNECIDSTKRIKARAKKQS
jgi:hypothetical protein